MIWIERHTVETSTGHKATMFLVLFEPIVARRAERLQRTEHEEIHITTVRHNVVDDGGRLDLPLLLAEAAERLNRELMFAQALPMCAPIEIDHRSCPLPPVSLIRWKKKTPREGGASRWSCLRVSRSQSCLGNLAMSTDNLANLPLSDDLVAIVHAAARPLPAHDVAPFIEAVTEALRDYQELGPGIIFRTVKQVQREFFSPPADGIRGAKHGR